MLETLECLEKLFIWGPHYIIQLKVCKDVVLSFLFEFNDILYLEGLFIYIIVTIPTVLLLER